MVQINLSAGQEERCRELICEHGVGGEGEVEMNWRVVLTYIYYHV